MRYEDTIVLTKQGGSRCFVIPAKWLKLNRIDTYGFRVNILIENDKIQIIPIKSRWLQKHPSTIDGRLMEIADASPEVIESAPVDPARSMDAPESLPDLTKL